MTIIKKKRRKPAPEKIIREQKEELAEMRMYIEALNKVLTNKSIIQF